MWGEIEDTKGIKVNTDTEDKVSFWRQLTPFEEIYNDKQSSVDVQRHSIGQPAFLQESDDFRAR